MFQKARRYPRFLASGALLFACLGAPAPVVAEISAGEYQSGSRRLSPAERAREMQRIELEQAREAQRERELLAEQERLRKEAAEAQARRPLGERLIEARCAPCHDIAHVRAQRHGRIGWWTVVARMQWLNGARFEPGERSAIVTHLARTQRAHWAREALEWVVVIAALALAVAVFRWRRKRRRG